MKTLDNIDHASAPVPQIVVQERTSETTAIDLRSTWGVTPSIVVEKIVPNLMQAGVTTEAVVTALESIVNARTNWEKNELAASHARLYAILASCYDFYLRLKSPSTPKAVRDFLGKGLDRCLADQGLATTESTHDMNRVVKAVFGADRRRVSAYAIALRFALVDGPVVQSVQTPVPPSELASWIVSKGGVEQARQSGKSSQGPTTNEKVQSVKAVLDQDTAITKIMPDPRLMPYGMNDVDKNSLLIVTYLDTGELAVKGVVKNDAAVKAALAAYYANNKDRIEQSRAQASAAVDTSYPASAIDIALSHTATA